MALNEKIICKKDYQIIVKLFDRVYIYHGKSRKDQRKAFLVRLYNIIQTTLWPLSTVRQLTIE